jgi:hypothetical protein
MENKILPETQKLIELFKTMPPQTQKEFREWIENSDPWYTALDKLDWDSETIDWGTDMEESNENEEQKLTFYCKNCMKFIIK